MEKDKENQKDEEKQKCGQKIRKTAELAITE
jgi:hypothetical protein